MRTQILFDWLGDRVSHRTQLSRTEARGMVRVAFRECGLQVETVTPAQVRVLIKAALAAALTRVKVTTPDKVCTELLADLASASFPAQAAEDAADVFGRLGKR